MSPKYKTYTLMELYEAREVTDKLKQPEQYQDIMREIELRHASESEQPANYKNTKQAMNLMLFRLAMLTCVLFFSVEVYLSLSTGVLRNRGATDYSLLLNPKTFYFMLVNQLIFISVSLYCIYLSFARRKQ